MPAKKTSKKKQPKKPVASPKKVKQPVSKAKKRFRDYQREYKSRIERGKVAGLSTAAARGHRKSLDEPSTSEWRQMRQSVASDFRRTHWRRKLADHVADVAEVEHFPPSNKKTTRPEWEWLDRARHHRAKFIKTFLKLGLGNEHQAYTLWFSP